MIQILLAEDNRGDVLLVREALDTHGIGYQLHVASDGVQAAGYIENIGLPAGPPCPDLLLLDLNLPKKDGHELLKLFRSHPICAPKPVIVITSSDAPSDRRRAAELGANYFRKALDLDEFMKLGTLVCRIMRHSQLG